MCISGAEGKYSKEPFTSKKCAESQKNDVKSHFHWNKSCTFEKKRIPAGVRFFLQVTKNSRSACGKPSELHSDELTSARSAAQLVKNFPVARQSNPSPPEEVNFAEGFIHMLCAHKNALHPATYKM